MNFALFCRAFNAQSISVSGVVDEDASIAGGYLNHQSRSYPLSRITYDPVKGKFMAEGIYPIIVRGTGNNEIPVLDNIINLFQGSVSLINTDILIDKITYPDICTYHNNNDGTSTPCILRKERISGANRLRIKFNDTEMLIENDQEVYGKDNKFYLLDEGLNIHEYHIYNITPFNLD